MNGVVNLSVLDGWWLEGYREGAGWALTEKRTYKNQGYQDQLDAATIYGLLENEIIPLYYDKNEKGYSEGWIKVIKNSIATIAPHYTMKRQLDDYYSKFYTKEAARFKKLFSQRQPSCQGHRPVEGDCSRALGLNLGSVKRDHAASHRNGDRSGVQDKVRHRRAGIERRHRP